MQLNYALCLALSMLIINSLQCMQEAPKYQGNQKFEKSFEARQKEVKRQREQERAKKNYYKKNNQDFYDEEFGYYEKSAADEIQRRKDKKFNK